MKRILIFAAALVLLGCGTQPAQPPVTEKDKPAPALKVEPGPGEKTRAMACAGRFYPADANELRKAVEGYIAGAGKVEVGGEPVALIGPHAGYVFSGHVAGHAYAAVKGASYDVVVVIGGHSSSPKASVLDTDYYQTPLGYVRVEKDIVKKLLAGDDFEYEPLRHEEWAIENHVPFLQAALKGNFRIVAIDPGNSNPDFVKRVSQALAAQLKGRKVLLVASTDLSHYPPYERAKEIDAKILGELKTLDGVRVVNRESGLMEEYSDVPGLECVMCGKAAVAIVLETAKILGADCVDILKYANSGDVPQGEKEKVVGYGTAVIYEKVLPGEVSKAGQEFLLKVARDSIVKSASGEIIEFPDTDLEELNAKRGVFVTLMKNGSLRGCVGIFTSTQRLPATVGIMANQAAFHDNRFEPVKKDEIKDIKISISILSDKFKKVKSVDEIVLGKHGIRVTNPKTGRGGTYLPEVPIEHNMSLEKFLSSCCAGKAGLSADAWKKGEVDIYTYTTQKFGEK